MWYIRNQEVISGLVAGVLIMNGIDNLASGHYVFGLVDFALAAFNLYNARINWVRITKQTEIAPVVIL